MKIRKYDPAWMIEAIDNYGSILDEIEDKSEMLRLIKDTILNSKVVKSRQEDEQYCQFYYVDPKNPNQPGSEWQHKDCVTIQVDVADFTFDLLQNGRIGGVEIVYFAQNTKGFKNSN